MVFLGEFFGFGVGDDLGLVVVLEEVFKLGLVEDDDGAVNDGDLVVLGHFEGDFGGEGLEAVAVQLPRGAAFESGGSGDSLGDVEGFGAAFAAWVGEAGDDAFGFLELVEVVAHRFDVAIFVLDEVDEGFGAADVGELGAVDDFVLAVGFFVFAAFEALVGFFDDVASGFLEEEGLDAGGELVGIANAVGGVVLVEEEEFDGDVVFDFVDFVGPVKDVKGGVLGSGGLVGSRIVGCVHNTSLRLMVPGMRLELIWVSPSDFKSLAYTNSANRA